MQKTNKVVLLIGLMLTGIVVLSACAPAEAPTPETITVIETVEVVKEIEGEQVTVIETVEVQVEVTAVPPPRSVDTDWPEMGWDEVLAEADGQTVNFWHWGGSDNWNHYFDNIIGDHIAPDNVTINSVLINDTVEAVNKVLGEVEAGRTEGGSVDIIWINGENFVTLRQADLLFGPYTDWLPNFANMNPADGSLQFDFGWPVNGYESPQGSAQATFAYNSAMVSDPPTTVDGLMTWVCENPGLFTYPTLPTFTGREFVLEIFYRVTGGHEQWQGRWSAEKQALFDEKAPALWDLLNEIEPCLWRGGATYPADASPMNDLYANGEIAWTFSTGSGAHAANVLSGLYPETTVAMIFEDGTHGSTHYVAIPVNSPNKAGALVVANAILSCEVQLAKVLPGSVGDKPAIEVARCSDEIQTEFDAIDYGIGGISPQELAIAPKLPTGSPELAIALEDGWRVNVLEK
jgi:putative spermidine/putrescine transport system substrate-binding protein